MSDSWVGGDIGGLRTMAETYKNAKKKLEDVVHPLSSAVEELVGDANWKGDAAETFRAAWSEDALTAGAFAGLVHDAGDILDTLVGALSACETALQNAEHIAVKKGVPMGAQGAPLQFVTSDPPSADEQRTISAFGEYDKVRTEILHTAQHARLVAADKLRGLYAQVTASVSPGDKITLADYLRGLYAYDAEDARVGGAKARTELDDAKAEEQAAKKELRAERKAFQKAGRALPKDLPAKSAYREAMTKVDSLEEDIARADHGSTRLPYDRALNVKLTDAAAALRAGESVDKLPDFLKEVPVLDVAAAGACGILEASDDHDKGWSWQHSVTVDGGANLAGLAAGTAITAGLVAAAPFEAPAIVVAGVGGAVVVGATGVIDHAFHEHWSEDIHDHGVVGGVLHGTGHVFTETGHDFVRLKDDVWHGIKSLF
ncbi:type VII secretion system (Wss) protein ESAT-6 [Streptomyces sp. Ag82_O1-15]|uniref:WXG100 family type VII secretion target n=1 Tax=Streptomyces sp. Ag82_O1-15 TaxID=1938855 RepID=UPI000BB1584E|nr:WXG100 family type VII secretion target [Streptomyces sp. Ag82_O1-15]PBC97523.1 type VII secretion system (Wss) protein ESAT-6 [Streptomyces sp. Ag82_O1-15]